MNTVVDKWREALIFALLAALLFEFVWNLMHERTIWQRLDGLEHRVEHLEKIHEQQDEDMRRRLREQK